MFWFSCNMYDLNRLSDNITKYVKHSYFTMSYIVIDVIADAPKQ